MPKIHNFPDGMTVKDFKKIVADWPETDEDGELTEVWIMTQPNMSNIVVSVWPLNKRGETADMILHSNVTERENR